MKTHLTLIALALLASAHTASAQEASKAPLNISADSTLEWDRTAQTFTATTNATAEQDGVSIAADTLTAAYATNKKTGNDFDIQTMTATNNVTITSDNNKAYGDQAVYKLNTKTATMTGNNLRLITPNQTITARDQFEYHVEAGKLIAIGNAKIKRPTDTIEADTITATLRTNNKGERVLDTMTATNNVTITTATERITGQKGNYNARLEQAEITGGVTLTRGPNILKGDRAVIDLKTQISKLFASPSQGGRVTGTFYPSAEKKDQ